MGAIGTRWVLVLCLLSPGMALAEDQVYDLSLDQAVELALKNSPRLRGADLGIEVADAKRKQARAQFGPKLQFELSVMAFNEPPGLGEGGVSPEMLALNDFVVAQGSEVDNAVWGAVMGLPSMFESEAYDVTTTVRVVQPLSPLWAIYQIYKLNELEVDLAQVAVARERTELAYQVREMALRHLQAKAALGAIDEALQTVGAHLERTRHFLDAGLIGQNELLQVEVKLAELKGKQLELDQAVLLTRSTLAMHMAIDPEADIRIQAPPDGDLNQALPQLNQVQSEAISTRPEMKELDLRIRQAEHGVKASYQGFIPNLALIGQYQHNEGSLMKPPAFAGGAVLDFKVWEWGASYYAMEEAEAMLARARVGREALKRGIDLQVRASWLKIRESTERMRIAQTSIVQAEEALRLEQERYEAQQNTSTDVLNAQMQLTNTRVTAVSAAIEYRIAQAALHRALGRAPGNQKPAPASSKGRE